DAAQTDDAEPIWDRAQSELRAARTAYADTVTQLEAALLIDGSRDDVRARLASAIYDQAVLAELARDRDATRDLVARLDAFDRGGTLAAAWRRPASLALEATGAT